MRVLIDTNIVLDVLLRRESHVEQSTRVWRAADQGLFDPYISSFSLPTIHYIVEGHADVMKANDAVDLCLEAFDICALYRECVMAARRLPGPDFEDNLQIAVAVTDVLEAIVTRNPSDFAGSPVPVYDVDAFLAAIRA